MEYKKVITSSIIIAFLMAIVNEFIFATENVVTSDAVLDGTLNVLVLIQKYSWPFVTLLMIFFQIIQILQHYTYFQLLVL